MKLPATVPLAALLTLHCGAPSDDGDHRVGVDAPDAGSDSPPVDPCLDVRCSGRGHCVNNGGYPGCVCEAGYRGEDTTCVAVDNFVDDGGDAGPTCGVLTASSAEASDAQTGYDAAKVLDGNAATFWLTSWIDGVWTPVNALPQSITLSLTAPRDLTALHYTPPDQANDNGIITQYRILTSDDGVAFTALVEGTWADDKSAKSVSLTAAKASYVRLEALAGYGGFAGAGELGLEGVHAMKRDLAWPCFAIVVLVRAACCAACTGFIGDSPESLGDQTDAPAKSAVIDRSLPANRSSAGLRLLTPTEYRYSIEDALGVTVAPSSVPPQQVVLRHSQIGSAQAVGLDEVGIFLDLALDVGAQALAHVGCDITAPECAESFAREALRRLFRGRESGELAAYLAMLDDASGDAGATVQERLVTLLASALVSPYFLYRSETSYAVTGTDRALDQVAIAERLSYLAWSSGPDEELLALAENGELIGSATRVAQLSRLLADPRAHRAAHAFVDDWMDSTNRSGIAGKDASVLAGTPADLASVSAASLDLTIDDVLFAGDGKLTSLLATDTYVMGPEVAALLGASAASDDEPVRLGSNRRGILMHPTVLAAHTKEAGASPFSIGKFLYESVLCDIIPLPAQIPSLDDLPVVGDTLRERMESATSAPVCQGCHARIGPPGYAFLTFDPIGRYSAQDGAGRPFDTAGTIPVDDQAIAFNSAADLSQQLARDPVVAQCIAKRVFRWTFGRFEQDADAAMVEALMEQAVANGADFEALLGAVVTTRDFTRVRREQ